MKFRTKVFIALDYSGFFPPVDCPSVYFCLEVKKLALYAEQFFLKVISLFCGGQWIIGNNNGTELTPVFTLGSPGNQLIILSFLFDQFDIFLSSKRIKPVQADMDTPV